MKKTILIILTILMLTLAACGASPASAPQGGTNSGELPASTQLIVGTLKLEGTAQAVTAEQAVELLPLWQTLQVLSDSDTAADQEKEALIAQIQETMTAGQMQAITNMQLTHADMAAIMQQQGMAMGASRSDSQNENSSTNNGGGFGPGGGGPPGGMMAPDERGGPGGGFSGGGQNLSADQIATAQAARQANESTIPPMLINAVIEYLQEKAGS